MGVGYALLEDYGYDGGSVLNPSFLDYKVPTALDLPEIHALLVEKRHDEGPFGAKGMGETTNVPAAAAIGNAIWDAVGVRLRELPITPDRVLRALGEKNAAAGLAQGGN